ncbi:hypothetical protein SFIMM107S_00710 [Streptomyces griseus]
MRLNDLDERIVHALAEDARRSDADIGALIGLSAPAVKRRVDRLRAEGAITQRGTVRTRAGRGEELVLGEVDPEFLAASRAANPYLHDRRPGLYGSLA